MGTWQCDESLTLASLNRSESVAPDDAMFSDNFFGDRVIVFKASEVMSYWVGEEWIGVDQDYVWGPYDLVGFGTDYMTLRHPATKYSDVEEYTWRIDGNLVYVEHAKWDFREYYRRIDD